MQPISKRQTSQSVYLLLWPDARSVLFLLLLYLPQLFMYAHDKWGECALPASGFDIPHKHVEGPEAPITDIPPTITYCIQTVARVVLNDRPSLPATLCPCSWNSDPYSLLWGPPCSILLDSLLPSELPSFMAKDSASCWKPSSAIFLHINTELHSCCRFVGSQPWREFPVPSHPKAALLHWILVTAEATEALNSLSCSRN